MLMGPWQEFEEESSVLATWHESGRCSYGTLKGLTTGRFPPAPNPIMARNTPKTGNEGAAPAATPKTALMIMVAFLWMVGVSRQPQIESTGTHSETTTDNVASHTPEGCSHYETGVERQGRETYLRVPTPSRLVSYGGHNNFRRGTLVALRYVSSKR